MKAIHIAIFFFALELCTVLSNPNTGYQSNWRWYPSSRNLGSPSNGSQTSDEGNARVRRNPNIAYQPNWRWIAYPRNLDSPLNGSQTSDEGNTRVRRNPNPPVQPNWRWIVYSRNLDSPPNGSQTSDEGNTRVRRNPNIAYQPNWRWIAYPRNLDSPPNGSQTSDEGNTRARRNPNIAYQPNWRWIVYSRNLDSPPNGSHTSDEGNTRLRRNPNPPVQPNWRWIAYPRNLDSPPNSSQTSDEGNTRARRNPNIAYQPNWRWIAYPRNLDSPPNGSQTSDEGNIRVRRNPNPPGQPNWRWIVYSRNLDSPTNDTELSDEGNTRVRRNLNATIGTGEAHENHKHSRPKPYEINQKNNDSSFDRSLYEGWYQTPASLAANKTLLFSGTWGNLHEMSQSDIVDTCDITNISICDDSNNIPGELRQCFLKPEDITSYAANLYNVTADKIQILKEDPNVQKLPFPDAFNVTISEVNQINGCDGNPTVCHTMMTNSSDCDTVYLCHSVKGTTVKQVIIDYNEEIKDVQMYAMCHMNTHNFGAEHVAFRMLHKRPGDGVCHFISPNSFLVCKN